MESLIAESNTSTAESDSDSSTGEETVNVSSQEATSESESDTPPAEESLFAGKYKTVQDLEKGYKEVVTKLTEKTPQAPEEYDFNFSENEQLKRLNYEMDEDPVFKEMLPAFKELNISQDQATALIDKYIEAAYGSIPDIGDEMTKLGPDGSKIISEVQTFVKGSLNEEERALANELAGTAAGVNFLHKMSKMSSEQRVPTQASAATVKSSAELWQEARDFKAANPEMGFNPKLMSQYERIADAAASAELKEQGQL